MGIQDLKFGRLSLYFESERLDSFGSGTWFDDSKIQFVVLGRNGNTIPIPLSRLEGLFRSQPGIAAMRSPYDMNVPPSARYVALARVAVLTDVRHCRASIVYERVLNLNWTFKMLAVAEQHRGGDGGRTIQESGLDGR